MHTLSSNIQGYGQLIREVRLRCLAQGHLAPEVSLWVESLCVIFFASVAICIPLPYNINHTILTLDHTFVVLASVPTLFLLLHTERLRQHREKVCGSERNQILIVVAFSHSAPYQNRLKIYLDPVDAYAAFLNPLQSRISLNKQSRWTFPPLFQSWLAPQNHRTCRRRKSSDTTAWPRPLGRNARRLYTALARLVGGLQDWLFFISKPLKMIQNNSNANCVNSSCRSVPLRWKQSPVSALLPSSVVLRERYIHTYLKCRFSHDQMWIPETDRSSPSPRIPTAVGFNWCKIRIKVYIYYYECVLY